MSTTVPTASRAFEGPSRGNSTNGPSPTPHTAEGLTKVGFVRRDAQFFGHIEDSGNAGRRIHCEPLNRLPGMIHIALQHVVDHDGWLLEVLHDVADALLHGLGHVFGIGLCHRLHDRVVGGHIGLEDGSVDGLGRIVLGIGVIGDRRIPRRAGTPGTGQHQPEDDSRVDARGPARCGFRYER